MELKTVKVQDERAMEQLGGQLFQALDAGMVILLSGELGAGKTTLVRGFLRAMSYTGNVKSPTYTLVEPYEIQGKQVYHFDFYRLNSSQELEYMGIRDYFNANAFCLIEWPQKAQDVIASGDLAIDIEMENPGRKVTIRALSLSGINALQRLNYE
jgi:tRNA threonylcarbamoyladenosine biosynthesis protein TsaE